jgi:hypothetical protein
LPEASRAVNRKFHRRPENLPENFYEIPQEEIRGRFTRHRGKPSIRPDTARGPLLPDAILLPLVKFRLAPDVPVVAPRKNKKEKGAYPAQAARRRKR